MLTVPTENYVFELLDGFDVDKVIMLKEGLLDEIANRFHGLWQELYAKYGDDEVGFSARSEAMADRAIGNLAFEYSARDLNGEALADFVKTHYFDASNLTDRKSALSFACRSAQLDPTVQKEVLEDFYDRWNSEALVLDLWFSVQAQSPLTSVEDLKALERHPKFDRKNPNRVRSVFSSFSMVNHQRFHALDGSGYHYLGDAIGILDDSNPQMAARLSGPLTRWARYDRERQGLMTDVLKGIASKDGISKDLFEIVSKSLDTLP
jgi:aminopeptidase N